MTAQMEVERTEEAKQLHFKLAYSTLLASLLVGWAGCYYAMLAKPEADENFVVKGTLWTIGLVGMAVSLVFMYKGYDRNTGHGLCMKLGVAFLVLNLVGLGAFVVVAYASHKEFHGEDEDKKHIYDQIPLLWSLEFAFVTAVFCICGCVAMCAFPRPRPTSVGYDKVPYAV